MRSKYLILIGLILLASTAFRLAGVNREFLGNFGQRQVYEAWISRNFINEGINILDVRMDALDFDGKKISVLRDFPLSNVLVAVCCKAMGGSIEFWGRFISVLFYAGTFIVLFLWLRAYFDLRTLTTILFIFAFLPISIVYFQSFIPEPASLFFFCTGMLFLERRSKSNLWSMIIGILAIGLSFSIRAPFTVLIIPVAYILWLRYKTDFYKNKQFYLIILGIMLIPLLWQAAAWQTALFKDTKSSLAVTLKVYSPRLGAYFNPDIYRKIFDDLTGIVLTPVGFLLAAIGLLMWDRKRQNLFFIFFTFSVLLCITLMPEKFYRHDYYYFPLIIPASVFIGYAVERLGIKLQAKYLKGFILLLFLAASLRYSVNPAFKTPEIQKSYLSQAEIIKGLIPNSEKIVLVGDDPTFLYYCDRSGWVLNFSMPSDLKRTAEYIYSGGRTPDNPIELLRHYESLGIKYIVVSKVSGADKNKTFEDHLSDGYKLIKETDFVLIYRNRS